MRLRVIEPSGGGDAKNLFDEGFFVHKFTPKHDSYLCFSKNKHQSSSDTRKAEKKRKNLHVHHRPLVRAKRAVISSSSHPKRSIESQRNFLVQIRIRMREITCNLEQYFTSYRLSRCYYAPFDLFNISPKFTFSPIIGRIEIYLLLHYTLILSTRLDRRSDSLD